MTETAFDLSHAVEQLRPVTRWPRYPDHPAVRGNPLLVALGTFVEPSRDPLRVIVTVDIHDDGTPEYLGAGQWLHLSVSRERRLPTWADLCKTRDALGYRERIFVQLVPPASEWLNAHSHCLHLVSRIDAETVPPSLWRGQGDGSRYGKRGSFDSTREGA